MELRADTAKGQFWNCSHCLAGLHFVISIPRKVSDLLRGDGGGRALAEMFFFSVRTLWFLRFLFFLSGCSTKIFFLLVY